VSEAIAILSKPGDAFCWRSIGTHGNRSCPKLQEHIVCANCPAYLGSAALLFNEEQFDQALGLGKGTVEIDDDEAPLESARKPSSRSLLIFELGTQLFALDKSVILEVAKTVRPTKVAHRAGGLLDGIVNVRGELYLSLKLADMLRSKTSADAAEHERFVIVRSKARAQVDEDSDRTNAWLFVASKVYGLEDLDTASFENAPAAMPKPLDSLVEAMALVEIEGVQRRAMVLQRDALAQAITQAAF
jgi:chemotaxis-related protein WspD